MTSTDPWTVVWGGPMRLVPLRYCSPCRAERAIRRSPSFVRHLLALSGVSAVLLAAEPTRAFGWLSVNILLFQLITFAVLIPVHEIGHAIAGRLVGLDVVAVVIGHGRTVWSGRLAGVPIELRAWPTVGGATIFGSTRTRWLRARMVAAVLGGPLANLACALVIAGWFGLAAWANVGRTFAGPAPLAWLWIGNWFVLLVNLLPRRVAGVNGPNLTDGGQLLRLLWSRTVDFRGLRIGADVREWTKRRDAGDAEGARALGAEMRARYPDVPHIGSLMAISLLDARAFADARTAFLSVLEQVEEPQARAMLQNNVAFTDFMMDAGEWRDEADALSAAAIAAFPKASSVLGTRGSVLVWLGRAKEGIPLLERSFAQHETPRDRATNACALAMGYHASGDTHAATRWLDIARRLDGRCLLLDRTTAAIADREGGARAAS